MQRGILSLLFSAVLALPLAANAATWHFDGALNANQEIPAPTIPNNYLGGGLFYATLNDVTGDYVLDVEFSGLTGPAIAAHIHTGAIGVAGPIIIDLGSPTSTEGSRIQRYHFETTFDADGIAMGTGNGTFGVGDDTGFYINIHTAANQAGEIRGQIIVSAVPLPAAVWLMGSALLGLFGMRRV